MDAWLDRARKEIDEATAGMTGDDWRRCPEGKWCSSEILEHLSLTFSGTAKMLEKRLASESPDPVGSPSVRDRVINFVIFTRGEIPEGRRAPEGVRPKGMDGEDALRRIREYLSRMDEQIAAAEKRWGPSAYIARHPILGPLCADKWRRFHFIHTRHHMRQVRARRQQATAAAK